MSARLLILVLTLPCCASSALAVSLGATKEDVITELGQPTAQAAAGNREILTYPKGVRLTLEAGQVVSAEKLTLSVEDLPETEETPTPAPTQKPARTPAVKRRPPSATSSTAPNLAPTASPTLTPTPTAAPSPSASPTLSSSPKPTQALPARPTSAPDADVQSIKSMSAAPAEQVQALRSQLAQSSPALTASTARTDDLPLFGKVLLLAVHLLLTLVALLIAFRVWNMSALNSGFFAIALIDLALHAGFQALGPITSGISTMSPIEYGIPGIVMIFTIQHFCFNKNISDAVRTTALVKILVAIFRMIAATALLKQTFH